MKTHQLLQPKKHKEYFVTSCYKSEFINATNPEAALTEFDNEVAYERSRTDHDSIDVIVIKKEDLPDNYVGLSTQMEPAERMRLLSELSSEQSSSRWKFA